MATIAVPTMDKPVTGMSIVGEDHGVTVATTALRDLMMVQRCTVLADSLADGIAGFWTQTTAGGGGIASTGGEGRLTTSTGTTGSAQISSPNVPYHPGQVAWMNSAIRFGDAGTAGNIRRLGMFTVSGTTPQEGFYFELNGTTLSAVTVKAGTATAVASTAWSRVDTAPYTLDTNFVSFEIRYTANTVLFYVNNILRHQVSGTSASLTSSLTLPITATNVKTSGATDITFAIRNVGNGRFGERPSLGPYNEASTPLIAGSGNVANASAAATLTGTAATLVYLSGFEVTGSGAVAGLATTVTVAGLLGGTRSYTYSFAAGVAVGNTPLMVKFNPPLPASAANTTIVVTCPASGAGGTNNTVVAHGFHSWAIS